MRTTLERSDVAPAMLGGLLLSAGGSGMGRTLERHDEAAEAALLYGPVNLVSLDEFPADALIVTSTSVGAPGHALPDLALRDHVEAVSILTGKLGRRPEGIICGHVPGFNAWLVAAALGIPFVDAAANGRGHPTVKMGGMGLASRPDVTVVQVAVSGSTPRSNRTSVVAEGSLIRTSQVMRHAAMIGGGLVASARGPFTAGFIKEYGAGGAISFQIDLGRAMQAEPAGMHRAEAAARHMGGTVLIDGVVRENTVAYRDGFDAGHLTITNTECEVRLNVFNEFMTADRSGLRIATFPDMIGSLDPITGDPVAIAQLQAGSRVAIVVAHRSGFPQGAGALDPAVFEEVELAMNADLRSHLNLPSA